MLLVLAVLGSLVVLATRIGPVLGQRGTDERRTQVLQQAKQAAVNFTTLDYESFDEDVELVLDGSTGTFREQFRAGVDDVRELVTQNRSRSVGTVREAALVSDDDDSARVLVVVDTEVTNVASTTPVPRHYRIQMDLTRTGDSWLVSDLTFVSSQVELPGGVRRPGRDPGTHHVGAHHVRPHHDGTDHGSDAVSPSSGGGRRRVAGERGRPRPEGAQRPATPPVSPRAPAVPSFAKPTDRPAPVPPRARTSAATVREAPSDPAPSTARRRGLLVVAAVVAVLLVVAAAVLVAVDRRQQRVADARSAALEQARTSAETVLSYSFRTLDDDFAAATAVSTGQFKDDYERTSQSAVREVATQTEAEVKADVVSAGVVSGTADRVVVLVFVDQTTVSNRLDRPKTDQNRVRLTMVRSTSDQGPTWLVEQVDAL